MCCQYYSLVNFDTLDPPKNKAFNSSDISGRDLNLSLQPICDNVIFQGHIMLPSANTKCLNAKMMCYKAVIGSLD